MDIISLQQQIADFIPATDSQHSAKQQLLTALEEFGTALFHREKEDIHLTVGALVLSPDFTKTLMVHHLMYDAFCWTGGHADGSTNLLAKAIEETKEETGIATLWCCSPRILGIYVLPVPTHEKHGRQIPAHRHFVVAYGLIAPERQRLQVKTDENKGVAWLPIEDLPSYCTEEHMLPIYRELYKRILAVQSQRQALYRQLPDLLLPWYDKEKRDLPWRQQKDPYHVWVSEIMLQQTRVEAVKDYYVRFMAALPTITALANAPEQQLLKLWEGLGYYSRARNLQKAARIIIQNHNGVFPRNYEAIRALPGVGDYTAGAISSICFAEPRAAIDGNVLRVAARLTRDYAPTHLPTVKGRLQKDLEAVYPLSEERCGDFTQSLMELGATVCTPGGAPKCSICPLTHCCLVSGQQEAMQLPVKGEKRPRRVEQRTVWVLCCGKNIALTKRQEPGLLSGYWQFPNVSGTLDEQEALNQGTAWGVAPQQLRYRTVQKHIFTHIEWHMDAYYIVCSKQSDLFTWVSLEELEREIPLPGAFRLFLPQLYEELKLI